MRFLSLVVLRSAVATRIACLGDSITQGSGASSSDKTWPALLEASLGYDYEVYNFGKSGRTMIEGDKWYQDTSQWRDALSSKADVVLIALGTNDAKFPENWGASHVEETFVATYLEMIEMIRVQMKPRAIYVLVPIPQLRAGSDWNDPSIINEVLPSLVACVAREANISGFVDLQRGFQGNSGTNPNLYDDIIHPNDKGYAVIAEQVEGGISFFTKPTYAPTYQPTTAKPSHRPTAPPSTYQPTTSPPSSSPTPRPTTSTPSVAPSSRPSLLPTQTPTQAPTQTPTQAPTQMPTETPTQALSDAPRMRVSLSSQIQLVDVDFEDFNASPANAVAFEAAVEAVVRSAERCSRAVATLQRRRLLLRESSTLIRFDVDVIVNAANAHTAETIAIKRVSREMATAVEDGTFEAAVARSAAAFGATLLLNATVDVAKSREALALTIVRGVTDITDQNTNKKSSKAKNYATMLIVIAALALASFCVVTLRCLSRSKSTTIDLKDRHSDNQLKRRRSLLLRTTSPPDEETTPKVLTTVLTEEGMDHRQPKSNRESGALRTIHDTHYSI